MPSDDDKEAILAFTANAPLLMMRLGVSFLRMKRQANRSAKRFYREMVRNGVPPQEARKLSEEYTSVVSLRHWFRSMGGFSAWKNGSDHGRT
jgi:hypothetical protein